VGSRVESTVYVERRGRNKRGAAGLLTVEASNLLAG